MCGNMERFLLLLCMASVRVVGTRFQNVRNQSMDCSAPIPDVLSVQEIQRFLCTPPKSYYIHVSVSGNEI